MAILKDLIVHGSSRFLNKIYANELEVSAFEAESAIIKKLTAKDSILGNATVIGLLDVQGQLHTNTWTNSNIATIDGCFYITPTLSSNSGTISFSSTSVASLTGTYAAVTSLYIGDSSSGSTVQWTKDSKVLLTGEVQVNGQWLPLGTLLGTLSANATTSSIGLTGLTDNRHNTSSIITDIRNAVSNASLNYRNLKISLYQRKDGTDSKPLGIYMTAMGTNGKTFIDIYGGVNATTTAGSSGGFADPNLRIGNLSGLGAVEGTTPTGWGIYTTNGYFKGVIVSSAGKIGNFTINSALYSNNHSAWNSNVSGIYINNDGISGGAGGKWWLWNDGSAKIGAMTLSAAGVLTVPAANVSGKLTAATIDGTQITANTITAGQIAASAITADELAANAVTSAKIKAGEVKATNIASSAITADKLDATTINASNKLTVGALTTATQNDILNSNIQIGGRNLVLNSNNELSSKNAITTYSLSDYGISNIKDKKITISADIKSDTANTGLDVYIRASATSSAENDYTIINNIGTSYSRFSVVVTVYSNDHIPNQLAFRTTQINSAATFNIKNVKVELGNKVTDWSPAPEDIQDGIDDAAKTATTYITDIDSNKGITIKPADTSGNDYLQINSSAINFYRNNVETLKIEDSAIRVGKLGNNLRNVYITDSAVQIRNNTSVLAEYGSSIKLYQPTTTTVAVEISSTGATFTGNVKATSLSTGSKTASTTGKGTFINSDGAIYVGNGSTNNFTVTDTGTITATGANLLTATIGNATNKITIGTGTSGHSSIRYGMTTLADTTNNGFYIGTDGIALGKGAFKVTAAGVLNATGATISGDITATSLTLENGVTIGYSSISNPPTIPTTVAQLTDSGSYLTTTAASTTYATQTSVNNEINARKAVYGTSSTDAGTATKAVTCSNFALYTGASVTVTFSKTNTSSAPQLNVNSTGAKPIKSYTGANLTEGEYKWAAGASITFTYDGTNWRMQDGGALQAKIDAASSASTASSQAGVATQQATNATNAKTAAESAKTAAESAKTAAQSAKTAAQSAKTAAETASSQASSAKDTAVSAKNDAVSAKTDAETAKGQAQTAAGNASQSATNAANSATAAAEVMGGFTILWNYSAFGTSDNGKGYLCAFDPATGTKSDANGWVKWNGVKRTITKQMINPNTVLPYNIPIYVVCRLSSVTATTGTNYMVWYNSGWKYAIMPTPTAVGGSWIWADNTDIILGKFVETASEAALTEYEIYNPPYTSKQITTNVVTAQSASASAASAAQTASNYISATTNGIKIANANPATATYYQLQTSTGTSFYVNNKKRSEITANGFYIYDNNSSNNQIASFDATTSTNPVITLGKTNGKNVKINNDGVTINIGSTPLASYGNIVKIGNLSKIHLDLNDTYLSLKQSDASSQLISFGLKNNSSTGLATLTKRGYMLEQTISSDEGDKDVLLFCLDLNGSPILERAVQILSAYQIINEEVDTDNPISPSVFTIKDGWIQILDVNSNLKNKRIQITFTTNDKIPFLELGDESQCYGANSIASGDFVTVYGQESFAIGKGITVFGDHSLAVGNEITITTPHSMAYGWGNSIQGECSLVGGFSSKASGWASVALGEEAKATGPYSTALGYYVDSKGGGSLACGQYNNGNSAYVFTVGNGLGQDDRQNAFWVGSSGNCGVQNTLYVGGVMRSGEASGTSAPMFWYETKTFSNLSISANSAATGKTIDITRTNHQPIGIVGIRILNATGGANSANCSVYIYTITNSGGKDYITFSIKNFAATAAKVNVEFKVFYIARNALSSQLS